MYLQSRLFQAYLIILLVLLLGYGAKRVVSPALAHLNATLTHELGIR